MAKETKTEEKLEREYTIPLRHRWSIVPTYKRANKAVKSVKEFLVRHMKIRDRDLNKVKIDKYLNETLWFRGIKHPPSKIKVRAIKEGDIIRVEAVTMPQSITFKKIREERIINQSKETVKKKKSEKVEEKVEEIKTEEQKVEEKEDKSSTVEAGKEILKEEAKKAKHETKVQSAKQEKNMKSNYNRMSQGH